MKRSNHICVAIILLFSLGSCKKYLDQKPDNLLTEEQLWQTRANAESYLNNIYSRLHNNDGSDYATIGASDESSVAIGGSGTRLLVSGNWNPQSYLAYNWSSYYAGIRQSFIFEDNIDKVPPTQMSDSLKQQYKAEAVFLRGWFFWKLLEQYGPFVKVTGVVSQTADATKYPRAPFDTCVAYINEIMDKAAAHLPAAWKVSGNYGRVTKGAALAVKAQLALWAASPLWNGNPYFANFKNNDGTALAPASYDASKWATAAAAAKAVIDLGAFKLFTNVDEGTGAFNPLLSVSDLFLTSWNNEIIMANNKYGAWAWVKDVSPSPGAYDIYNATQNAVDAFCMSNGRTIDDPASGYVETGFAASNDTSAWGGHLRGEWNMYAHREARFYAYVQYNMHPVLPAVTVDDKNYYSSSANQDGTGRVEYYYSGKSGQVAANSSNITGYGIRKGVSPSDNIRNDVVAYRPQILIRYAEILLDYVEALNESDPSNPDIVTYLDMVRARAGLPGIETVYPGAVGNQDQMRKYILRERQVELCFESGDRYYTLVRRKLLGNAENQVIYGMNVNADDNGQGFSFTGFYTRTLFQNRFWNEKMYLFPIYQTDIDNDNAIVQNPGW